MNKTKIVTAPKLWMEGNALQQLNSLAELPDAVEAIGMPDLHAGKTPVGVTLVTENRIYPHVLGNDLGCGMTVFNTGIQSKRMKPDKWASELHPVKSLSSVPNVRHFDDCPIHDFGTIGSGNHFAEFQQIGSVLDAAAAEKLGLDEKLIYLTVHSGSRNYGSRILSDYSDVKGYTLGSAEADGYITAHNNALFWAKENRAEVAAKLTHFLGYDESALTETLDCFHNFMEVCGSEVYHRKGSVSSKNGAAIIAGSRGTLSYIVMPTAKCAEYGFSLAHGSGRKWTRSMCKSRIRPKHDYQSLIRNDFHGRLVCRDLELVYQEAPEAYKNIETVIQALLPHGMITLVASLKPMLTFKG